ncbi:MAG: hypothetical protein ACI85O_003536 [Saprospiraceae bacterium]|jgi:hypothetical protein
MENLKELILIVNKQKIAKVEVMGNPSNYSGKMKYLYDGIINGKYLTDDDAIIDLYSTSGNVKTFKKLKYRLQNRLINTVFFIDVNKPNFNDSQRAYYICQKSVAAIDILLGRGARKTAIELAERTLRHVLKFEYTEMCINLLKKLSRHYGIMEKNKRKFIEYSNLTQKYLEIFNAETVAEQLYTKLRFQSKYNSIVSDEIIGEAISSMDQLKKYLGKVDSNRFLMMAYMVFVNRYKIINDYENVLKVCDKALGEFKRKEDKRPITVFMFSSLKIDGLIQLKRYKEAEVEIINALKLVPEGKISWLNTNEKYMRMCIHTKEYQKAFDIFTKITSDYGFQPAYKDTIETWKVYEAYLNFFIQNEKIIPNQNQLETRKKFRINKFLNEVPIYSKDKRGFNIPILIIQVLFLLQQKKHDGIIDKVEALNAYCYRHLKKDETFRSNCFIKMLLLLPKCNFHRVAVDRKSKVLVAKLQSVPLEIARQSVEIEIVPYEDLWEIVMDMLEAKFYKK